MKNRISLFFTIACIILLLSIIFYSCNQEEHFSKATIKTNLVTTITEATANCGGLILTDGGSKVTSCGVCWGTSPTPTIENDSTTVGADSSSFMCSIKGLSPSTTYYVRAYAVNKAGVAYGFETTFTTKTYSITTSPIALLSITAISVICGGNIISDGDSSSLTVNARGVCWSTFPSPTIENNKTTNGIGGGRFTCKIDSLLPFTTYYIRAYATNNNGTIYGNEVIFTTQNGIILLTTINASAITAYTATIGGHISSDGGAPVIARGVCWSSTTAPTIENSKTVTGSGIGTLTSNIIGLVPSTTYFVRTYATNCVGTSYGNELSFTTQSGIIKLTTNTTSSITPYTAISGGTITSDGGALVTERGVCWSTSSTPTIENNKSTIGFGTGAFTANITGLTPGTTYYLRTYAINNIGVFYGNEVCFTTLVLKGTVTDVDGNLYHFINYGTQIWMVENLRTTKYRNGESIGTTIPADKNITDESNPKYQWAYKGVESNVTKFGRLYTGYVVSDSRNIAPAGWHVPTYNEWSILKGYLIANGLAGNGIAKSLAATTDWIPCLGEGVIGNDLTKNNTSGFTALPGGYRHSSGNFGYVGIYCFWWTSTDIDDSYAYFKSMYNGISYLDGNHEMKYMGYSVRCIKDLE